MSAKKTIVVVGATGAQGGGLVWAICEDPQGPFQARAITRDAQSTKAKALKQMGAQVVAANLDDVASLVKAFEGAYGAFLVTNYWEHMSPERETAQAANMARAAKEAKLQHVIWSTMEDSRDFVPLSDDRMPTLMEHYKVPHFDAKADGNKEFTQLGVPTTFLHTAFYWDNFINFDMGPKRGNDGSLTIALPMGNAKLACIAAEDIGSCAYGIFKAGSKFIGQSVYIAGESLTGKEMAALMSEVLGQSIHYHPVALEVYREFGFPGVEAMANMFQCYHDFAGEFCGRRDVAKARELHPDLMSFRDWLIKNETRIPIL